MSLNELAVIIAAENRTSAEFQRVAADANQMGVSVEKSGASFQSMQTSAESCNHSLAQTAMVMAGIVSVGNSLVTLAANMGVLDNETAKYARTVVGLITVATALLRLKKYLTVETSANTAAVALNNTVQGANAGQSIITATAYKVKAAATWVATTAQNALNISYGTFLALTGVGLAVIAAATAAMWAFASSMNAATSSVNGFNEAGAGMNTTSRNIQRAGEDSFMLRRGIE